MTSNVTMIIVFVAIIFHFILLFAFQSLHKNFNTKNNTL